MHTLLLICEFTYFTGNNKWEPSLEFVRLLKSIKVINLWI